MYVIRKVRSISQSVLRIYAIKHAQWDIYQTHTIVIL